MGDLLRTRDEREEAAADAEAWLDALDPATTTAEDPADLRWIGIALRALADEQREVEQAVAAARANGRSRGEIGLVLGVSRQAARERYGQPATAPRCRRHLDPPSPSRPSRAAGSVATTLPRCGAPRRRRRWTRTWPAPEHA